MTEASGLSDALTRPWRIIFRFENGAHTLLILYTVTKELDDAHEEPTAPRIVGLT